MPDNPVRKERVPSEALNVGGTAAAIFGVVATGAGLSATLPDPSPWLMAAAYGAPAGVAFVAYWWVAQKL
jgi:hypothetical protein